MFSYLKLHQCKYQVKTSHMIKLFTVTKQLSCIKDIFKSIVLLKLLTYLNQKKNKLSRVKKSLYRWVDFTHSIISGRNLLISLTQLFLGFIVFICFLLFYDVYFGEVRTQCSRSKKENSRKCRRDYTKFVAFD